MKLSKCFTIVLFGGFGLLLLDLGITNTLVRQRQIETFLPVQAEILSSRMAKPFYHGEGKEKEKYNAPIPGPGKSERRR